MIKPRRQLNIIEPRSHIRNDPKDEPHAHPRRADNHGHVLAGEAERAHAQEIEHPVHGEGAVAISYRVEEGSVGGVGLGGYGVGVGEVYLEGEADEGVGEGEEYVGCYGGEPAPWGC